MGAHRKMKTERPKTTSVNKASKKSFKADSGKSKQTPLQLGSMHLEDDDPDFPRGGGSSLSKKERDDIRAQVDAEFDSEERFLKKKNKKGKHYLSKSDSAEDDLGSLFGDGLTGKLPRFANKITLKNISPGMKLWGVVVEVNEKDLVVGLPGGLRGLVRAADALDTALFDEIAEDENNLPSIFHVGQLVACTVLQLDEDKRDNGKRKIWLSLRLSLLHKGFSSDIIQEGMVLSAYVKSIEDHGYILHFGIPSYSGFVPKDNQDESRHVDMKIGQIFQGVVERIDKTRKVVYLSPDPDSMTKCVMKDIKGISIDLLVPGMMVNSRVQSTLENGIMLSFLTYFTGTVDIYNLQSSFPTPNWKGDYYKNMKVNARILFVDPLTRAVGLTLNHHLVHNNAPPLHATAGDIYDSAKVIRVDRGLGLLLEIPSAPVSTPAYVHISDVAEDGARKLEKKFKEGATVRVRILGFRHLEGLATGILKASAFEGSVFTHSDVKPGMVMRAKILLVDSFGAIVQFPGGVKALCPLRHMSEFEVAKPGKKFKVGAELLFRVLGCKSKRITVTHKKTLVKSKLAIITSYADATDGLVTHGWITTIENHGCFVRFYNGVQGFAPRLSGNALIFERSELGLEAGSDTSSMYHVGQVVKCRVMSSIPASRRINLSFTMKPNRVSQEDVKLGSIVAGVVEKITSFSVVVGLNLQSYFRGTIPIEHLADHHGHAALMQSVLKPGFVFDKLLILVNAKTCWINTNIICESDEALSHWSGALDVEIHFESNNLVLSAKYSLINSADQIPSDLSQVHPNSVVHGYICNLIETGCFVRFLGRLTGFSPKSKALDERRAELSEAFYIGQSVRCNIHDVNSETNRVTVSLKQSCCASTDASFIQQYFLTEEKIAGLQSAESSTADLTWVEGFNIGSIIEGKIEESKEFGVVVSFERYADVFGFISHSQCGKTVESGSTVRAVVLDVAMTERLVDLSLKPQFFAKSIDESSKSLQTHKKKRKTQESNDLEVSATVNATVEMVLSIPEHNYAIGYASISDYNTQKLCRKQFLNGQSVVATVMALPGHSTLGRLLLLIKSISGITETSSGTKARKKSGYDVGSLVQAEITEIRPLEMRLKFGIGFRGRIHITEVYDACDVENPFDGFKIGQTVSARIVEKAGQSDNKKSQQWELSIKPRMLSDSFDLGDNILSEKPEFSSGQRIAGYVYKVDSEWAWLTVTRHVKAQLYILDSACEPSELREFQKRFLVGKPVVGHVLSYNKDKASLRLVLRPLRAISIIAGSKDQDEDEAQNLLLDSITAHIHEGDIVGGRISKILPGVGGLVVLIGPHLHGRVHFTELQDSWVQNPLSGCHEGEFVKTKVLEISHSVKGTVHVDLSLRLSLDAMCSRNSSDLSCNGNPLNKRIEMIEDLHPDMVVQGYVKNVTSKGCFISLSRKLDAKILLSNLSNEYVENPEKEFPIGQLVHGRVLSVEPSSKRVEVTLKKLGADGTTKSKINGWSQLHVGDIISGTIKRVEAYGLFITIDHTNVVGLCHVSELSDDHITDIESKYTAGEKVRAKILKVDVERHRISLGMKNLEGDDSSTSPSKEQADKESSANSSESDSDSELTIFPDSSSHAIHNMDVEYVNVETSILAQAESRASVPPLEVTLDDAEQTHMDDIISKNQGQVDEADTIPKKKIDKKKSNRESEIRAAEERRLLQEKPSNADEYEKLVRSSPNSSFIWLHYMGHMLKLADVEGARSLAERALRTINFREEDEKLNIWVAYCNLEHEYGNPPQEAVEKVIKRALQYCDPKKFYLALLKSYEEKKQEKLADDILHKMIKKFKTSCKVWVRQVHRLLDQKQDGVESVVRRALLSLPRHKHIKFIRQTAIYEFKYGVPDRGRALFEEILREYPKKTDIWSVYLDQEIKLQDVDVIRGLFERAISLSLPPKNMKFLFKKYLEYEKTLGNEERIEYVKQKAIEYVENTLA
ncbi:hypothetical protein Tsubulata_010462 [Turnera subulata]|uniref:Protein RRP5 homolog n=1 Tax=Turnera subulata TaxID=218843 RepID=A0A9Q0F4E5_9ROSI|nr:hypothetical protein Tsubulata_010462 [Turnera subulata]